MSAKPSDSLQSVLAGFRVIPVLTVDEVATGIAVCEALKAGGIRGVEITLRTPNALRVISAVQDKVEDFVVGAGTVKTVKDLRELHKLNVEFAVSPGFTQRISDSAFELDLPLLPGVSSASEIMAGLEAGRDFFKLFPAEAVGGIALLKAFASPFVGVSFCPTGGIGAVNFRDYLALPNVVCVGGSWMVASLLLDSGNWSEVQRLSRECFN